jgi:hypothetical protein
MPDPAPRHPPRPLRRLASALALLLARGAWAHTRRTVGPHPGSRDGADKPASRHETRDVAVRPILSLRPGSWT